MAEGLLPQLHTLRRELSYRGCSQSKAFRPAQASLCGISFYPATRFPDNTATRVSFGRLGAFTQKSRYQKCASADIKHPKSNTKNGLLVHSNPICTLCVQHHAKSTTHTSDGKTCLTAAIRKFAGPNLLGRKFRHYLRLARTFLFTGFGAESLPTPPILKSSSFLPALRAAASHRGFSPRPAQVSLGFSGLRYFGATFPLTPRPKAAFDRPPAISTRESLASSDSKERRSSATLLPNTASILPRRSTSLSIDIDFKFITRLLHLTDYLNYIDPAANASQKDRTKCGCSI